MSVRSGGCVRNQGPDVGVWRSTSPTNMAAVKEQVSHSRREIGLLAAKDSPQILQDSVWGDASSGAKILDVYYVFNGRWVGLKVHENPAVNQSSTVVGTL